MIEVGHPFSVPFQSLVDGLTDSLQLGVEQPGSLDVLFRQGTRAYPLRTPVPASGLARQITGFVKGKPAVFDLGLHYTFAAGQLLWLEKPPMGDQELLDRFFPDDNSRLAVGYFYRDIPSGLTDFNAGSVTGTLVRAMAREFKILYEQMDQAYRRAFIDHAEGAALDNVVALLGITRNQAMAAQGEVTFSLKKAPKADVPIATGTRVADARGRLFKVTAPGLIKVVLQESVTAAGKVVKSAVPIGGGVKITAVGGGAPLNTVPTLPGKPYGEDGCTITLKAAPLSPALTLSYQPKTPKITVPVMALDLGSEGNLGSGSLTIMPTPPRGVDGGVLNELPLTGGKAAEADEQLRERAKHELEKAGNATLNAIRYAVLSIDDVDSVEVRDFSVDETIPLGEVWVRFASGQSEGDTLAKVTGAVEKTRAAGIKARVSEVSTVILSGKAYVIPDGAGGSMGSSKDACERYNAALLKSLAGLGIGEPLSMRKLAALAFQIPGLSDVAEIQLDYRRKADLVSHPVASDPFLLDAGEQARADAGAMQTLSVRSLSITAAALLSGKTLNLTVRILDDGGAPIRFRKVEMALLATLRARHTAIPNEPLQQVAQVLGKVVFTATHSAAPVFPEVEIPGLAGLDLATMEVSVALAAYPGVLPGVRTLGP